MGQPQLLWGYDFWVFLHIITWFLELEWTIVKLDPNMQHKQWDWLCKMGPSLPCPSCGIGYNIMISKHPVDKTRIFACFIDYHTMVSFKIAWFADYHMEQQRITMIQQQDKTAKISLPPGPSNVPELTKEDIKTVSPVDYYRDHYTKLPPTEEVFWPIFWRVMRYVARGYITNATNPTIPIEQQKYKEETKTLIKYFYTQMPNILPYVWKDKRDRAFQYVQEYPIKANDPTELMNWIIEMEQFVHNDKSRMTLAIANATYISRLQQTQQRFMMQMKEYQTRFDTLRSTLRLDSKTMPTKTAKEWAILLIPKPQPHFYDNVVTKKDISTFKEHARAVAKSIQRDINTLQHDQQQQKGNEHNKKNNNNNKINIIVVMFAVGLFFMVLMIVILLILSKRSLATSSSSSSFVYQPKIYDVGIN